ncbi:putative transporter [Smittium culicis]|uniref:Putative transporter n=1 Tax=Smittium culicis TaxID=133412 RepID=A0A1R1YHH5_9FUNG|nr:putative transporter [Smittium culicis]
MAKGSKNQNNKNYDEDTKEYLEPAGYVGNGSNTPKSDLEIMYYDSDENTTGLLTKGKNGYQDVPEKAPNPYERKLSIEEVFTNEREGIIKEITTITKRSLPLLIGSFFASFALYLETASIGFLGKKQLAGFGLAHIFVVFMGYPMKYGIIGGLETLCSQAHTGLRNTNMTEIYLLRSIAMYSVLTVFNVIVWNSTGLWLSKYAKDAEIAYYATLYLRTYWPAFYFLGLVGFSRQYMYAKGITKPVLYFSAFGSIATIISLYFLVINKSTGIGFVGVPIATTIGNTTMLIIIFFYIKNTNLIEKFKVNTPCGDYFPLNYIDKEVFTGWGQLIKFAFPSMILIYTTSGTNELVSVAATLLRNNALAVQSVLNVVTRIFIVFFVNFSIISTNRMGNALGANVPQRAKIIFMASTAIYTVIATFIFIFIFFFANVWSRMFSKDLIIIKYVLCLSPLVAVTMIFEIFGFLYTGLLRGQGRQVLAVKIKLIAFYGIGTPIGWILGLYFDWRLNGLWTGMIIGHSITAITMAYLLSKTDWELQVQKTKERLLEKQGKKVNKDVV